MGHKCLAWGFAAAMASVRGNGKKYEGPMKKIVMGLIAVAVMALFGIAMVACKGNKDDTADKTASSASAASTASAANGDMLDAIRTAKKVRVAIDLGVPPYGMTDDKMQPAGSDVDTARALAKDWGVEFELVPTTGASRIPSLQTGKADLVISTLSITPERAQVIDFSPPYAVIRQVVAGSKSAGAIKSMADLNGKTVATVRGTTHDTQLTKEGPKGMKLVRYDDDATEGQAFLSGQADVFSTAEMLLPRLDKKNPARQVEVKFVLSTAKLAIGIKKGETRLLAEVNKWVTAKLKDGTLNDIYKKQFGNDLPAEILNQ
jgi:polar amino acid transport system substrate-binding protein